MNIERWGGAAAGRSRTVAMGEMVWTVANARDVTGEFDHQVAETLAVLDASLLESGTDRSRLLSVQVLLADIADRPAFDAKWCAWIGPDPGHWPQRACYQAALAPGLRVELIVTAARP